MQGAGILCCPRYAWHIKLKLYQTASRLQESRFEAADQAWLDCRQRDSSRCTASILAPLHMAYAGYGPGYEGKSSSRYMLLIPCMHVMQAEEFLKAHSTTASVPSAPLHMVQASAAALDLGIDQSASVCLSEPCSRCPSPPMRAESACLPEDAGMPHILPCEHEKQSHLSDSPQT